MGRIALWNSLVVTLVALPLLLAFAWTIVAWRERSITLPQAQKRVDGRAIQAQKRVDGRAIGALVTLGWMLFWDQWGWQGSAQRLALPLTEATTALLWLSLAYAFYLAPLLAWFARQWRAAAALKPSATNWVRLHATALAALYLLCINNTPSLLLTAGRPFNATHTLASWSWTQAWVNGDGVSSLFAALPLVGAAGVLAYLLAQHAQPNALPYGWLLLALVPWLQWCVPLLARYLGGSDGRWPLFIGSGLGVILFMLGQPRENTRALSDGHERPLRSD
jgi:hypothetical protein